MRTVFLAFLFIVSPLIVLIGWMAGGRQRPKLTRSKASRLPGVVPPHKASTDQRLNVVTWNISWGYGWGSAGTGSARPESHFYQSLSEMARCLRECNPDIVLLQEVDFHCTRSHYIDQADYLAREVQLPYVAKGVSWRANWVPYPYWPPENHFGEMCSGGAILSRYPIHEPAIKTMPKPSTHPWWYNLFYLFRYHQYATIETPAGPVLVCNVHTEAFDQDNRIHHVRQLAQQLSTELLPLSIVGGDLNSVPPEASIRGSYPDEPETSHRTDPTVEMIRGVTGLFDTIPAKMYLSSEPSWMTFPSHAPNRKLDYLFHSAGFRTERVEVPRSAAGDLSDHLPIVARLVPLTIDETPR